MAESGGKRGSVSGKVATPKTAPGPASSVSTAPSATPSGLRSESLNGLRAALGARIQVKTVQPDNKTLIGVLFTADPILNIIAINCSPAPPNPATSLSSQPGNYHIIPLKHILSFQILSLPGQENQPARSDNDSVIGGELDHDWTAGNVNAPPISRIDIKRLKQREEKAVQKQKDDEKKKGKGVSPIGQELFYSLDKMYSNQTRWADDSIILMDSVRIDPPYTSEDVKAPKDKQHMVPQIKKVVDGERRKIANRAQGTGTPPVGPRKGG
ncbi:hypothetical protein AAFC00_001014 [Neodothiora populina]|uniref:AD domain-containing protein n=1 Tax=Neodothiora populina TaxID=2781224 RepID=A0ABR3PMW2_9PEZI